LFAANEVAEIWITFPDPQIKYKRTKHRLTNIDFLHKYKNVLSSDGLVHLKTDSETEIQTFYENQYLEKNKAITYIQFRLTN